MLIVLIKEHQLKLQVLKVCQNTFNNLFLILILIIIVIVNILLQCWSYKHSSRGLRAHTKFSPIQNKK